MRGTSDQQIESLVALTPEDLVPQEHPIRRIKLLADQVLQELSPTFSRMYAKGGRPSVPPEHLLKASLLIALSSVRSERQSCEWLPYNMFFRRFLRPVDIRQEPDPAAGASVFRKLRACSTTSSMCSCESFQG